MPSIPSEVLGWTLDPFLDSFMCTQETPSITFEHLPVFDIGVEFTFILYHFAEDNAPAGAPHLLDASRLL
jgi:hypothetical protein